MLKVEVRLPVGSVHNPKGVIEYHGVTILLPGGAQKNPVYTDGSGRVPYSVRLDPPNFVTADVVEGIRSRLEIGAGVGTEGEYSWELLNPPK
jgi:hypothetical protein